MQMRKLLLSGAVVGAMGALLVANAPSEAPPGARMIAAANDVDLTDADVTELGVAMTKLQPHPDVIPALEVLAGTGSTLAALTNSPQPTAEAQLANAGLAGYFATIMSVDMVGRFKPAAEVYVAATKRLQVPIAEMTMVAAHDWDIAGAMRAGARGALVTRPGVTRNPLYPEPDVVASDMRAVVDALLG